MAAGVFSGAGQPEGNYPSHKGSVLRFMWFLPLNVLHLDLKGQADQTSTCKGVYLKGIMDVNAYNQLLNQVRSLKKFKMFKVESESVHVSYEGQPLEQEVVSLREAYSEVYMCVCAVSFLRILLETLHGGNFR